MNSYTSWERPQNEGLVDQEMHAQTSSVLQDYNRWNVYPSISITSGIVPDFELTIEVLLQVTNVSLLGIRIGFP